MGHELARRRQATVVVVAVALWAVVCPGVLITAIVDSADVVYSIARTKQWCSYPRTRTNPKAEEATAYSRCSVPRHTLCRAVAAVAQQCSHKLGTADTALQGVHQAGAQGGAGAGPHNGGHFPAAAAGAGECKGGCSQAQSAGDSGRAAVPGVVGPGEPAGARGRGAAAEQRQRTRGWRWRWREWKW